MAQYLQLGISYQITFQRDVVVEQAIDEIKSKLAQYVNLNLFDYQETDHHFTFTIKETMIKQQLCAFLEEQFALYHQDYQKQFSVILSEVAAKQSLYEIVGLAKEQQFQFFQHSTIYDYIKLTSWQEIRFKTSLITIFVEGKIIMESYEHYLHYMEKLIRSNSAYSIAGAFRACIQ